MNLYIGIFEHLYQVDQIDEGEDIEADYVGHFTLVVHAADIKAADILFANYMDEHENDDVDPILGVVYQDVIVEIGPEANIETALRFAHTRQIQDLHIDDGKEICEWPDADKDPPGVCAYVPEGEEVEPFWRSEGYEEANDAGEAAEPEPEHKLTSKGGSDLN